MEAGSAPEAIRTAADCPDPIDVVIADVVMPHTNCDRVVAEIRTTHPNLKAVLISGYPEDVLSEYGVDARSHPNFLQKPFTAAQLQAAIREALGTGKARSNGQAR